MIWLPLLAAILIGFGIAFLQWIVKRSTIDLHFLLAILFMWLFLWSLPGAFLTGRIEPEFFLLKNLFLFSLLVVIALVYNLFLLKGLRRDSLHEYELIDLLLPLFTIILAALIFVDERDPAKLILAMVAATAFLLIHLRRRHFQFKQADRWLMYAIFLMATEDIFVKPLLTVIAPVSLYSLRVGLATLWLWWWYRPPLRLFLNSTSRLLAINALIGMMAIVLMWLSIHASGIVVTRLVLLATPVVLAVISLLIFHERWQWRQTLVFVIILICLSILAIL